MEVKTMLQTISEDTVIIYNTQAEIEGDFNLKYTTMLIDEENVLAYVTKDDEYVCTFKFWIVRGRYNYEILNKNENYNNEWIERVCEMLCNAIVNDEVEDV